MKLQLRPRLLKDHVTRILAAVLVSESPEESKIIDKLFGDKVLDSDGLIARRIVEVRLSDGYGEHYLHVLPARDPDLMAQIDSAIRFSTPVPVDFLKRIRAALEVTA